MFYNSKEKLKKVNKKIVKYNLYILAHIASGFNSYVVFNLLPQWRTVVSLIKNGAGIVSLEIFNGYLDEKEKIPQYVLFRCGRDHINNSLEGLVLIINYSLRY